MKTEKKITPIIIFSILLLIIAGINIKYQFVDIPNTKEMISRQIDYVTISTVFAGFSFTALGLVLRLSSEELIDKIKNTSIIMKKVNRIIWSIVFFILSVAISLIFVLTPNFIMWSEKFTSIIYVLGVGYMIVGIVYFVYSVYELFDLLKRIYGYNKLVNDKKIKLAKEQMEKTRNKIRKSENDEQL